MMPTTQPRFRLIAGQGIHPVAGTQQSKECDGDGMGAGGQGRTHEAGFGTEDLRRKLVDGVSATVSIAVARGGREHGFADLRLPEAVENVFGIFPCDRVYMVKHGLQLDFRLLGETSKFG